MCPRGGTDSVMEGCATAMILTAVIYPVKLSSTFSLYYRQLSLWYLVRALIIFICPLSEWCFNIFINKRLFCFNINFELKYSLCRRTTSGPGLWLGLKHPIIQSFLMSQQNDLSRLDFLSTIVFLSDLNLEG